MAAGLCTVAPGLYIHCFKPVMAVALAISACVAAVGLTGCDGFSGPDEERGIDVNPMIPDAPPGGFPNGVPDSVKTLRIVFQSDDKSFRCCAAVDPFGAPPDAGSNERLIEINQPPAGDATIQIDGFATEFVPTVDGITEVCSILPVTALKGQCDPMRLGTPSFRGDPTHVFVPSSGRGEAPDIPLPSVPFLVNFQPPQAAQLMNPIDFSFIIADSLYGIEADSVRLDVSDDSGASTTVDLQLAACDDAQANTCSPGGALSVSGYKAVAEPLSLSGSVETRIRALNLAPTPQSLDFTYNFGVETPTPTNTPTDTPTPTNTSTSTPTFTPTRTATQTPTSTATFTNTPTNTPTFSATPTATPTSTPTSTATSTSTPTATITATPTVTATRLPGVMVYVPTLQGNVSVVDADSGQIQARIPVAGDLFRAAITADSTRVYVTSRASNLVSIIDTSINTRIGSISVGNGPNGIALTADGATAYVANEFSDTVAVVNLDTRAVVATIPVGRAPTDVAIDPQSAFAYVSNRLSATVSVIDLGVNEEVDEIFVGSQPEGLEVSPDNSALYVAQGSSNTVAVIDPATRTVVDHIVVGERPRDVAISPDGLLVYVVSSFSQTISVIQTSTNDEISEISVGFEPIRVALTPDGQFIYIASSAPNSIGVVQAGSHTLINVIGIGGSPTDLAIGVPK